MPISHELNLKAFCGSSWNSEKVVSARLRFAGTNDKIEFTNTFKWYIVYAKEHSRNFNIIRTSRIVAHSAHTGYVSSLASGLTLV